MRDVVCHMSFPLTCTASYCASLLMRDRVPSAGIIPLGGSAVKRSAGAVGGAQMPLVLSLRSTEEGIDGEHKLRKRLGSDRLAPLQGAYVLIAVRGGLTVHLQTLHGHI